MVAKEIVDGAGVDSIVFKYYAQDHPEIVNEIRILEESPPFGIPPIVMRAGHNNPIFNEVRGILMNMHRDPEGAALLKKMHFDRFELPDTDSYETADDGMKGYEL